MDRSPYSFPLLALGLGVILGCGRGSLNASHLPEPAAQVPADPGPAPAPTPSGAPSSATAVFAGGCFWCTEAAIEELAGVDKVVSGYAGGTAEDAVYELVGSGKTNHAESIEITYDPKKISFGKLLQVFFTIHDPTQLDRQGPDWGHQYRSAIFYASEEQRKEAAAYIDLLREQKTFHSDIVTTLEPLTKFYPAEDYHQDYVKHHPDQGYVRVNSLPKIDKVRKSFPELLKKKQ